jgi:hypothetical protein
MFDDTSWVPADVSCTLTRDLARRGVLLLDRRRDRRRHLVDLHDGLADPWIAPTASPVAAWIDAICCEISSVAFAVCVARFFTSDATTAKPLPASPARAAFDRRIQRQQVGLRRDVADQLHHVADLLRRLGQALDLLVGLLRLLHGAAGHGRGALHHAGRSRRSRR